MTYISYFRGAWERQATKKADPTKAYAKGPGLISAVTGDKKPAEFTVFSFDEKGAPWPTQNLKVSLVGPKGKVIPVNVTDGKEGTYLVGYSPTEEGEYTVTVEVEGKLIKDMPKKVTVKRGADGSKSKSSLTLTIQAHLPSGEAKREGGDRFQCLLARTDDKKADKGAPAIPVKIADNGNGTYSATFDVGSEVEGKGLSVSLLLNGAHIPGSPFALSHSK